jgi:hypothetical protein
MLIFQKNQGKNFMDYKVMVHNFEKTNRKKTLHIFSPINMPKN